MRLTDYTDYALRVLIYLGVQSSDKLITIDDIAGAYGISKNHLMKIVHQLGRAELIKTVRGRGGGIRLARAPESIGIGDVVRAMEGDFLMVECFRDDGCAITKGCALRAMITDALNAYLDVLDRYTLADVLANPTRLKRALHIVAWRPGNESVA
jgi:Rrf2 family nitric oxide-sensitive transcriptional repressor